MISKISEKCSRMAQRTTSKPRHWELVSLNERWHSNARKRCSKFVWLQGRLCILTAPLPTLTTCSAHQSGQLSLKEVTEFEQKCSKMGSVHEEKYLHITDLTEKLDQQKSSLLTFCKRKSVVCELIELLVRVHVSVHTFTRFTKYVVGKSNIIFFYKTHQN